MAFVRDEYVDVEEAYEPVVAPGRKSRKKDRETGVMVREPKRDH